MQPVAGVVDQDVDLRVPLSRSTTAATPVDSDRSTAKISASTPCRWCNSAAVDVKRVLLRATKTTSEPRAPGHGRTPNRYRRWRR